ncbi:MAG: glycosyltransferase [Planctomycetes bacterium]|nr:glycosyltransferase [Planctomycetota bacterium]
MSTRLAYLLKKFPRLSETFILNELLAQENLGRELHVFSRRAADNELRHPELARLRATVETLPPKHEIDPWEMLIGDDSGPDDLLARLGAVLREARTWGHPRTPLLMVEALHVLKRTRVLGIQHVHVHFATDSAVVALLMHKLGGPSYSITCHAKDIYRSTVDFRFLDILVRNSAFVVTVCDANRRWMTERLSPEASRKVRKLYNGIDLARFVPDGSPREPNHVLGVGRLVEKKGFHVMVEALALLLGKGVDVRASLIGDGDQKERIEQLIAARGIGAHVRMLGPRDQAEVRAYMSRAVLMLQPCLVGDDGNRDALPTVLIESLAMGLPSISTPVTGIPEILDQGRCGVMVPENDVQATADAIESLLADSARRARIAADGRRHAEEVFDAEKTSRILSAWFDEALQTSCAASA